MGRGERGTRRTEVLVLDELGSLLQSGSRVGRLGELAEHVLLHMGEPISSRSSGLPHLSTAAARERTAP